MTETKPKRRWLRFSIRDMLWLTVVVGMGIGWWLDHKNLTRDSTSQLSVYSLADARTRRRYLPRFSSYMVETRMSVCPSAAMARSLAKRPSKQQQEIEALVMRLDVPKPTAAQNSSPP